MMPATSAIDDRYQPCPGFRILVGGPILTAPASGARATRRRRVQPEAMTRLSGQLFCAVRAVERPCAKYEHATQIHLIESAIFHPFQ